ncbi:hypothetical protein [Aureimonas psammosilenae]|uniref:hypothetical protein n=1 Tax=Aureimonas psammosilenae TaxID=2495496 RepID=UPI001260B032|nr:hypothetical protein [Aureimonas psammosilenae]
MSATDSLFFPPTGEESSYYLLVTISGAKGALRGRPTIQAPITIPEGADAAPDYPEREGELAAILKEAGEFAAVNGYPLRVSKPAEVDFPSELGTYAERKLDD